MRTKRLIGWMLVIIISLIMLSCDSVDPQYHKRPDDRPDTTGQDSSFSINPPSAVSNG